MSEHTVFMLTIGGLILSPFILALIILLDALT